MLINFERIKLLMKKIAFLLCVVTSQVIADNKDIEFFEPNVSNKYQGRLISTTEDYPIERMKKSCKPFTGIDTAQIRCKKNVREKAVICDYKCSLHWMVN